MQRDSTYLSPFVRSYIETALWSSNDGDGVPLDSAKYADAELAEGTIAQFVADCERFQVAYEKLIAGLDDNVLRSFPPEDHIPHDFWLTRNRHGAGFWDGDYPEPIATQLTELAHSFGECDLYVGDDGLLYV
jgi:hypothetical protein